MNTIKDVKVIGFDLDQTLYPKSPKIDQAIQQRIFETISCFKNCSVEEAKNMFHEYYPGISGRKTLIILGMPNPEGIIQDALENADISEFLNPDPEVISLLKELKQKYGGLSLITGSYKESALMKLKSLEIPLELFDFVLTGEISKSDGEAFRQWLKKYPDLKPRHFLYIGDRKSTDVDIPLTMGMRAILVNAKKNDDSIDVPQFSNLADISEILL